MAWIRNNEATTNYPSIQWGEKLFPFKEEATCGARGLGDGGSALPRGQVRIHSRTPSFSQLPAPSHCCPAPGPSSQSTRRGAASFRGDRDVQSPEAMRMGGWACLAGSQLCLGIRRPVWKTGSAVGARWPHASQGSLSLHFLTAEERLERGSFQNLTSARGALRLPRNQLLTGHVELAFPGPGASTDCSGPR